MAHFRFGIFLNFYPTAFSRPLFRKCSNHHNTCRGNVLFSCLKIISYFVISMQANVRPIESFPEVLNTTTDYLTYLTDSKLVSPILTEGRRSDRESPPNNFYKTFSSNLSRVPTPGLLWRLLWAGRWPGCRLLHVLVPYILHRRGRMRDCQYFPSHPRL